MSSDKMASQKIPTGAWSVSLRQGLTDATIASLPPDASMEQKYDAMEKLIAKLRELQQFDSWDPRQAGTATLKRNYSEVERIPKANVEGLRALQVIPDGRIVVAGGDNVVRVLTKGTNHRWDCTELKGHTREVRTLNVKPDGTIITGSNDSSIGIWTPAPHGGWESEFVRAHFRGVHTLQALPDGTIISGGGDKAIGITRKDADGKYITNTGQNPEMILCAQALPNGLIAVGMHEVGLDFWSIGSDGNPKKVFAVTHGTYSGSVPCLQFLSEDQFVIGGSNGVLEIEGKTETGGWFPVERLSGHHGRVTCLQAQLDGTIVSGGADATIRSWRKTHGIWGNKIIGRHTSAVVCLHVLPDARIVSGGFDGEIRIWDDKKMTRGVRA